MRKVNSNIINVIFSELRRIGRFVAKRVHLMFRPSTASEKAFIDLNQDFWNENTNTKKVPSNTFIFIHYEQYPTALLGNMHIASTIASLQDLRLLLIVPSYFDKASQAVLKSFPNVYLEYEDNPRFLLYRVMGYLKAFWALRSIKTPDQLLAFSCDGVLFGDALYDTVLSYGFATINNVNISQVLPVMAKFYYHRAMTKWALSKYRVINGCSTHIIGVSGAVFLRYLLLNEIPVHICGAGIKKYRSLAMMHECWETPDKRYIDFMKSMPEKYIALGERAIENRLGNKNVEIIDHQAYKAGKTIYTSREQFCSDYALDPEKRNVFVMLHAFNDYPHTYGNMVHQDFYHWIMHVLELSRKNRQVNWIFKNHPYAKYYPTDVDVNAMFQSIKEPHIKYMEEDVNFNTSSLRYVGDVVITCLGTAGLEYSTFGIPCILAARCWYSGLGFTREPGTRTEFENELLNISQLARLTDDQVRMAKIMAYFSFEVMNPRKFPDPFRTSVTFDMDEAKTLTSDQVIEMIMKYRLASTNDEKNTYMKALTDFIVDPACTQFVDFAEHPELRGALSHDLT